MKSVTLNLTGKSVKIAFFWIKMKKWRLLKARVKSKKCNKKGGAKCGKNRVLYFKLFFSREERDTDSEIDKVLKLNRLNEVAYEVEKWKRAKQAEFRSTLHQVQFSSTLYQVQFRSTLHQVQFRSTLNQVQFRSTFPGTVQQYISSGTV